MVMLLFTSIVKGKWGLLVRKAQVALNLEEATCEIQMLLQLHNAKLYIYLFTVFWLTRDNILIRLGQSRPTAGKA